ncbi:MAG: VCBS repeat-containing protein [Bacteroidota bacterium]
MYTPKHFSPLYLFALALLFGACNNGNTKDANSETTEDTLFTLMSGKETGIDFLNEIENQKNFNIFKYRNFYNGGGVAIGDINNDGLADVYMTANMTSNKLYLNKGNWKFEDITEKAGVGGNKPWSTGVTMADVNGDGLLDIYISNAGNYEGNNHDNDLYINNGDLTFSEKAEEYNLAKTGFSTHAAFFDYDKDGDLDAYILNNSNVPVSSLGNEGQRSKRAQDWESVDSAFRGVGDLLMRNDGDTFTDVSDEAGIYGSLIGFGLGVMITDINQDLYPDIYISNDFFERDYLYLNNQDGTFTEDIKNWTSRLSLSAMGVDISDINNDGLQDIFITDMLPEEEARVKSVMEFDNYNVYKRKQRNDFYQQFIQNTLQLNNGNNSFTEIAYHSGIEATDWSWSGIVFDMDNDGYRDIYITNGINHDLTDLDFVDFFANEIMQSKATGEKRVIDTIINKMPVKPLPNYAYHNNGDITFTNKADDWGFGMESMSNGAAYGDLDNDGDLDLIVNNVNMPSFVYRNNSNEKTDHNYLQIELKGKGKNPFAVGASVRLYYEDKSILQELVPVRGFQSCVDYKMTIGLGQTQQIDSLRVIWPDDTTEKLVNISSNQVLSLDQSKATLTYSYPKEISKTLLTENPNPAIIAHKENAYNDFDYEGLISQKLSQEGPSMAVGDVNGDGHEDVFIGGAAKQPGVLYLHDGLGQLKPSSQQAFVKDAKFEDTVAAFFDADNDGDLDLMQGSGGNESGTEKELKPRLYLNNGQGVFTESTATLPSTFQNTSVLAPHDFDEDGDIDVFVGSRSVVGVYGVNPPHMFLENQGDGTFVNNGKSIAYPIKDAGMITDGQWVDIDGDAKKDLVLTTDWGGVKIYRNNGKQLSEFKTELDAQQGWWNTVEAADLDNDGDMDLVLGNEGSNIHYRPTPETPMKLYINDFDSNGTIEQITTLQKDGKDYPIHQKKELTGQLVSLKKQNIKASDYAHRSIDQLFSVDILAASVVKQVEISESIIAINNGSGSFTIKKLPTRAQLSCVCGVACTDINGDGLTDLILGGNNFELKPQYSQMDGSYGDVLVNKGNNEFEWLDYKDSGFFVKGEIKHIAAFKAKNGKEYLITAINEGTPKIFTR